MSTIDAEERASRTAISFYEQSSTARSFARCLPTIIPGLLLCRWCGFTDEATASTQAATHCSQASKASQASQSWMQSNNCVS